MVLMLAYLKYLIVILLPLQAWADLTIFDVRQNLPMSESDPVFRDYIIDGGSESGLSVGMLLTVQRRLPLYDSYQNHSAGDLLLKVARIKIIYVQKGMAVARLHSEFTREATPLLEDGFIMVGDHIDLSSASSEKKAEASAPSESQPTAAAPEPKPQPVASAAQPPQIVVNTVELSSQSPVKAPPTLSQKVDVPNLQ
jgi:hypothetical protein